MDFLEPLFASEAEYLRQHFQCSVDGVHLIHANYYVSRGLKKGERIFKILREKKRT